VKPLVMTIHHNDDDERPSTQLVLVSGYNLATLGRMLDDILREERRFTVKIPDGSVVVLDPANMKTLMLTQDHAS
jgi:hypothetical protein